MGVVPFPQYCTEMAQSIKIIVNKWRLLPIILSLGFSPFFICGSIEGRNWTKEKVARWKGFLLFASE
jgi:hypothetical protein